MQVVHSVTITLSGRELDDVREALLEVLMMTSGKNFRSNPGVLRELAARLARP